MPAFGNWCIKTRTFEFCTLEPAAVTVQNKRALSFFFRRSQSFSPSPLSNDARPFPPLCFTHLVVLVPPLVFSSSIVMMQQSSSLSLLLLLLSSLFVTMSRVLTKFPVLRLRRLPRLPVFPAMVGWWWSCSSVKCLVPFVFSRDLGWVLFVHLQALFYSLFFWFLGFVFPRATNQSHTKTEGGGVCSQHRCGKARFSLLRSFFFFGVLILAPVGIVHCQCQLST